MALPWIVELENDDQFCLVHVVLSLLKVSIQQGLRQCTNLKSVLQFKVCLGHLFHGLIV